MLEGMYSAAAGMAASSSVSTRVANDLANVYTTGYKHVRVAFRDLLYTPRARRRRTSQHGAGAAADLDRPRPAQGALHETGEPLDVAIKGPGFLQVSRADGTHGAHARRLAAARRDRPPDQTGQLARAGRSRSRRRRRPTEVTIAADGTVRVGTRQLGRIELVDVPAPDGLQPAGDNLFRRDRGQRRAAPRATTPRLAQGTLEASNVDVGDAMTDMIEAQRGFQLASKAIQIQDQILEIANQVKR